MSNLPFLIGLHGKAGAGKDTFAQIVAAKYHYNIASFAAPLKKAVSILFDVPETVLADRNSKDNRNPYWNLTYRQMMQFTGTEAIRKTFGEDFWIRRLIAVLINAPPRPVIITDCRFQNEVDFILKWGCIVHIVREDNPYAAAASGHASEEDLNLPGISGNCWSISNSSTLEHYEAQIHNLMNSIITQYKLYRN